MPANGRRGRPQGKCHRKQTAAAFAAARVKGWGKSPPRDWQQKRHGKPHREQDRIGAVRRETFEGCFRPTARVGCVRRMATCAQDEWPPRSRAARRGGHTEPGLQASWHFPLQRSEPLSRQAGLKTPRSPARALPPARSRRPAARSRAARHRRASIAVQPMYGRHQTRWPIQSARSC